MKKIWEDGDKINFRELREIQLKRLKATLRRAWRVPAIRRKWTEVGFKPENLKTLEDLEKIPFMSKEDFTRNFPFGLLAVPLEKIVRLHMSSGTTGDPKVVAYTAKDIEVWANLMARGMACIGITSKDILVNTSNHNVFTGGLGIIQGAELLGATAVPLGPVGSERTLELIMKLKATVIHAIPSFGLKLAETAKESGIRAEDLPLRIGIFGAEPWSEQARKRIEDALGLTAYDNYGLSELCGPGVAIECPIRNGLHIWSDYFIPEIIDPKTGEVLEDDEKGELVLTALWKEAIPIVRYRTGDLCSITHEACECGRIHPRISRITGRTDDMLIIKGVSIFPSQIEDILMRFDEITDNFQIVIAKSSALTGMKVKVEVKDEFWNKKEEIAKKIAKRFREVLLLGVNVECVREKMLPRSKGKARRVVYIET